MLDSARLGPGVVELLYWRDVKTTGVVFGASLLLLLSLTVCSIVSVCSYIGLALLSVTICFRIYKGILQAIQKSDEGHPFKQYLDQEVALSDDTVHKYSDVVLEKLNKTIEELRRLFLVEDLVDSIKFAVLMWILTYVGALFNGLTLLILGLIGAFSCPIIYEKHQAQIDHYLALVNNQIKDVVGKVQAKVPGLKLQPCMIGSSGVPGSAWRHPAGFLLDKGPGFWADCFITVLTGNCRPLVILEMIIEVLVEHLISSLSTICCLRPHWRSYAQGFCS
ncbi:Reticulon-4 [Ameca splendens]|uniref:Reticulon n=1 Tax=Ameca splendens TaxID=208324 RepID=A0ABV0XZJ3_9TELE